MRTGRTHVLLLTFVVAAAGSAGCATYSVRRSALVPQLAPSPHTGQPVAGRAELGARASTAALGVDPSEASGANAGLYVARTQFGGGLRARVSENFDLGPLLELGLEEGSMPIARDMPDRPHHGSTYGLGVGMQYSIAASPRLRVCLGLDLLFYSVPYREVGTCVKDCEYGVPAYMEVGRQTVGVASFAVLPSYALSPRATLFGGVTIRNQPTNTKGSVAGELGTILDADAEVREGPYNVMIGGGLQVALAPGTLATVQLVQPITQDPVVYGPLASVGLSQAFGR